jgi:PAS domain S-box-containing protein
VAALHTPTLALVPAATDPHLRVRQLFSRYFFGTVAVSSLLAGLTVAWMTLPLADMTRAGLVWGFAALLALSGYAMFALHRRWALAAVALGSVVMVVASALALQLGLHHPAMAFLALITCVVAGVCGRRAGLALGALCALAVACLAWGEAIGWLGPAGQGGHALPLAAQLLTHALLLGAGLGGGLLLSRVVTSHVNAAAERERRFLGLLWIAADGYWESDRKHRLTALWEQRIGSHGFLPVKTGVGLRAWEMPQLAGNGAALVTLKETLHRRDAFRNLRLQWAGHDGRIAHLLLSGEPRFNAEGRWIGYWGVSRNATEELAAHDALQATENERRAATDAVRRSEALLSELFATSPDLITLAEGASGRYEMVNDAFEAITGYSREEALGRTPMELGLWQDAAERDHLLALLAQHGRGQNVPVTLVGKHGQRISLLVSAAQFQMDGRDYQVTNARDVTEMGRTRKELEAILQNASIGIAFTRDGRFVRANERCEQMFGWPPGGLAGQPGRVVWPSEEAHEAVGRDIGPVLAAGQQAETERPMARRDGSTFLARILAKAVDPLHPRTGGTIWILDDVTERRQVDQALAKARDDAEAASRAKSAFLANTSHELRTPLNGLVGLTRLALQPELDDESRRHYLQQINDSAETLSSIISDILDLSKIEAGKLHLETVSFDLHELLQALQRGYGTLANSRGLPLQLETDPQLPQQVLGDPVRLRQILGNFLSNALKFTMHGSVTLRARVQGGARLRFEVQDTGPGIAPEVQQRLFRPFVQGDESTTRRYGGTGLGLSICSQLATLMDGEVGVHSEAGRGSVFWVELPLPETEATEHRSVFGGLDDADALQGARVLLVEDNPVNMLIGVALLEQWGVQVTQATHGAEAIAAVDAAAARGLPFHCVLMDVQMPEMSGHEATRTLRRQYDAQMLPIIALTAAALVSEREEALAAGMNDFLTKPIDAHRLRRTLGGLLRRRRRRGTTKS